MERVTHLVEAAKQFQNMPFILTFVLRLFVSGKKEADLEDDTCITGDNVPVSLLENIGRAIWKK